MNDPAVSSVPATTATSEPTVAAQAQVASGSRRPAPKRPCIQHTELPFERCCDRCRAPMCALCDFAFPGLHVCPVCVATPGGTVSIKRTGLAIAGLAVSVASVAFLGSIMGGMLTFDRPENVGLAFTWLIFLPAALGLTLSFAAMDRNRGNNALLWTASSLGSLQLGIVVAFILYGSFVKS